MSASPLCDEVDRLRGLLARALPWIDPNDSHEGLPADGGDP